jgi:hypothetical protein
MKLSRFHLFAVVLLVLAGFAAAQSAEDVIEKYLQASGGRDALSGIQTRIMKGTFAMPDMGMYAPIQIYTQAPDKSLTYIEIPGMGSASNGVNGEVAWEVNPMVGARVLRGPDRVDALLQARIEPLLEWKKLFAKAELAGEETVAGKKCWKLVMTAHEGSPTTQYIDQESGLIARVDGVRDGQSVSTSFSDYKPVGGVQVPHKMVMMSPQFNFEMTFESVEHNVPIPPEKFALPSSVQSQVQ